MQIINRKTELVTKTNTAELLNVQASFNTDGRIVLRTFSSLNEDELIVLTQQETTAIFTLFKRLKVAGANLEELPF